jgi:hypothetical protein
VSKCATCYKISESFLTCKYLAGISVEGGGRNSRKAGGRKVGKRVSRKKYKIHFFTGEAGMRRGSYDSQKPATGRQARKRKKEFTAGGRRAGSIEISLVYVSLL